MSDVQLVGGRARSDKETACGFEEEEAADNSAYISKYEISEPQIACSNEAICWQAMCRHLMDEIDQVFACRKERIYFPIKLLPASSICARNMLQWHVTTTQFCPVRTRTCINELINSHLFLFLGVWAQLHLLPEYSQLREHPPISSWTRCGFHLHHLHPNLPVVNV
jgi:hypothetical protein